MMKKNIIKIYFIDFVMFFCYNEVILNLEIDMTREQLVKTPFFGRKYELELMQRLLKKKTSSLIVIKGRRRIGKSRLALEFSKFFDHSYILTGFPPKKEVTDQQEKEDFAGQMERKLGVPGLKKLDDWGDIFWHLSERIKEERVLLVLDEINWMGSKDSTFLGKLKNAWDTEFSKNPRLVMVLSGSMSGWIKRNILSDTGFMGRISLDFTLNELPLRQCNHFWGETGQYISAYEKFKILSVTGGVPRYLEEIDPDLSAEDNIKFLAFQPAGLLYNEFDRIFSDLFSKRAVPYKKILKHLVKGPSNLDDICHAIDYKKGGVVSDYLEDLVETGYLSKDFTWKIKEGKESLLHQYRLKDNYMRFYLKFIEPNKSQIKKRTFQVPPAWYSIIGLQFENLVLNNNLSVFKLLGIEPSEVIYDNPFFQRKTKVNLGCQVDYMIQTTFNTIYLCEIKFSRSEVGTVVIEEVKKKIKALNIPKNFSIRPVLIHVNGATVGVIESRFFSKIIDFSDLLEARP